MCACVHLDVIQKRIELDLPPLACSTIDKLQHTFSQSLLNELDTRLKQSPFFQQWFQALQSKQRIRVVKPTDEAAYSFPAGHTYLQYLVASFFGHQEHVVSGNAEKYACQTTLQSFGIAVHTVSASETLRCDPNPIYGLTLTKETRHSPTLIERYFTNEKKVVIYDRYLHKTAATALAVFSSKMAAHANVAILTTSEKLADHGQACADAMQMANNTLTINLAAADYTTTKEVHDRHIFIGNRYNMRFSSGLDVFGNKICNAFLNDEGSISVYDVFDKWRPLVLKSVDGKKFLQRVSACA
jgi:hypothetical protein